MKTLFFVLLSLLIAETTYSQPGIEKVSVNVSSDSVIISDSNVYVNCGAIFIDSLVLNDYKITIIEKDTSTNHAFCNCNFDLSFIIHSLQTVTYTAYIYRQGYDKNGNLKDTTIFIDSVKFTMTVGLPMPPVYGYIIQSPCKTESVGDDHQLAKTLEVYPNPSNDEIFVKYLPLNSINFKIEIFDINGNDVIERNCLESDLTNNLIKIDIKNLINGKYYGRIIDNGKLTGFFEFVKAK